MSSGASKLCNLRTFHHLGLLHFLLEVVELGRLPHVDAPLNALEVLLVDFLLLSLPLAC